MAARYTVAPGQEFNYPVDHFTRRVIEVHGGRSKVPKEVMATLKFKTVKEGDDCSDMPAEAFALYLERGWILDAEAPKVEVPNE